MTEAKSENVGPKPWDTLVASDKKFVQRMQRLGGKSALPADFEVNTDWLTTVRDGRIVKKSFPLYGRKSLDVSALSALEDLTVNGNTLTELKLGALPRLRILDIGECALEHLDLSGCPAVEHLRMDKNRFTRLPVLPESVVELDCSDNPLIAITLRSTRLKRLEVARCQLEALDVYGLPALESLSCHGNRIRSLDLQRLGRLVSLHCGSNGATIRLPKKAPFRLIALSENPVASFDAKPYPLLETLFLSDCGLEVLTLDNPKLGQLGCEGNQLKHLDLARATAVRWLQVTRNPLGTLDVRPLSKLSNLEVDDGVEVLSTPLQNHVLPPLRARAGLPKPTKTLSKMDPYQLHAFAAEYNWDHGEKRLFDVIRHPQCQLATGLLIYWNGQPDEFTQYATAKEAPRGEKKVVELLREIEVGVRKQKFKRGLLAFNVHDVEGVDLSDDDPRIPAVMRQPATVDRE